MLLSEGRFSRLPAEVTFHCFNRLLTAQFIHPAIFLVSMNQEEPHGASFFKSPNRHWDMTAKRWSRGENRQARKGWASGEVRRAESRVKYSLQAGFLTATDLTVKEDGGRAWGRGQRSRRPRREMQARLCPAARHSRPRPTPSRDRAPGHKLAQRVLEFAGKITPSLKSHSESPRWSQFKAKLLSLSLVSTATLKPMFSQNESSLSARAVLPERKHTSRRRKNDRHAAEERWAQLYDQRTLLERQ